LSDNNDNLCYDGYDIIYGDTVYRPVVTSRDIINAFSLRDTCIEGLRRPIQTHGTLRRVIYKIMFINNVNSIPMVYNLKRKDKDLILVVSEIAGHSGDSQSLQFMFNIGILPAKAVMKPIKSRKHEHYSLIKYKRRVYFKFLRKKVYFKELSFERLLFTRGQMVIETRKVPRPRTGGCSGVILEPLAK
jgi:hypothetical protein